MSGSPSLEVTIPSYSTVEGASYTLYEIHIRITIPAVVKKGSYKTLKEKEVLTHLVHKRFSDFKKFEKEWSGYYPELSKVYFIPKVNTLQAMVNKVCIST